MFTWELLKHLQRACKRAASCKGNGSGSGLLIAVFRNQLPRKNDTYSYNPPPEEPPLEELPSVNLQLKCGAMLCRVCGCLGPSTCSKCHKAHYCSKDHQIKDWKAGHKVSCLQPEDVIPDHKFLFPEYEIVREHEELDSAIVNDTEQEDLGKNEDTTTDEASELLEDMSLEMMAKHETPEDRIFQIFKERISLEPEQVIRYCRNGEGPIWISGLNVPQDPDIPNCQCGSKRVFEFQVMPQLLAHLNVDSLGESIDWGTLAIYTCAVNCDLGNHYAEEFIWKQDISNSV
ncbi:programmed cell death protein 2 isoform X2 [Pantherophis guttatus]|uniref:Programmed cell death protein 2 isoform X2 n=1 Tax=Pantherophis guttatus TaxID=94885 RepID=A0A6P9CIQ0_PANGU|nr:programmed cell death protein 2 isoform X2 [Pantherophis guttatus]